MNPVLSRHFCKDGSGFSSDQEYNQANRSSTESANGSKKRKLADEKSDRHKPKDQSEPKQDISFQTRQNIWRSILRPEHIVCAATVVIPCPVCHFSQIQWNATHHMAHIVARMHGGNNLKAWNRMPVCASCNINAGKGCNLFDLCMDGHPDSVVPIAIHLKNQLATNEPAMWQECLQYLTLEQLVRFFFGKPSQWPRKPLKKLFDFICEHVGYSDDGKIENSKVYEAIRVYDEKAQELRQIENDILDTQIEIQILRSDANADKKQKEILDAEIRLMVLQNSLATAKSSLNLYNFTYSSSSGSNS